MIRLRPWQNGIEIHIALYAATRDEPRRKGSHHVWTAHFWGPGAKV